LRKNKKKDIGDNLDLLNDDNDDNDNDDNDDDDDNNDDVDLVTDQKRLTCRNGHGLHRFQPGSSGYGCDVCGRSIPIHTDTYGCRQCNWDACDSCMIKPDKCPKCSLCTRDMLLSAYTQRGSGGSWICGKCKIPGSGERHFCYPCNHCLCIKCGKKSL